MLIDDRENMTFEVSQTAETVTITFTDSDTTEEIGVFQIDKSKIIGFINALSELFREIRGDFGEFDPNKIPKTNMTNKESGSIRFEG